ncbi:TetR/AcrR family transcriptional regulator [Lacticigenium naphthae]|uniref:TetR/AcrR family transcriptional regulator n=1 Tax=Lacticigenium naphthae TaxID=515351 RepID=UPI00041A1116|nr:TetR/AcrR family transcriptional regulator [Lacticigenium naphthae]
MSRKKKFSVEDLYDQTHHLLMETGYDHFSFGLLADHLNVSRAAIYKYYSNKDDLINDYLTFEMKKFLTEFEELDWSEDVEEHFNQLFQLIFNYSDVHQLSTMFLQKLHIQGKQLKDKENISEILHEIMLGHIQSFIVSGQEKGYFKSSIPAPLLISMIFHSVMIEDRSGLTSSERAIFIREILAHGIFQSEERKQDEPEK